MPSDNNRKPPSRRPPNRRPGVKRGSGAARAAGSVPLKVQGGVQPAPGKKSPGPKSKSGYFIVSAFVGLLVFIAGIVHKLQKAMFKNRKPETREQRTDKRTDKNKRQGKNKKVLYILLAACGATVVAVVVITTVWLNVRINGQNIYLDGNLIGAIKGSSISAGDIYDQAVLKLKTDAGAPVKVNETVTAEPVHAKKFEDFNYIVGAIYTKFTYQVQVATITVDGVEAAVLKTDTDADNLLQSLLDEYKQDGLNITSIGFVEDVETTDRYADTSEIMTSAEASAKLTAEKKEQVTYTVKSGDTLWSIATANGMTVDDVYKLNPSIDSTRPETLKVGANIVLSKSVPFLSVKSIERDTYPETIKFEETVQYDDTQPKSYSKIIQQGKDGYANVTADITRINGEETDRTVVNTEIVQAAVNQIKEVGTK